ncbi:hypothetical protein EVAR_62003_1 [Eumeta japonica]|uniref:Uncharacterized protein n=1 Tax=Eumeta variegata TaxID=151549 RepID=A0A4C1YEH2_EUMVA|nr:hypothetical protein EVAR_62003_1 [Eumeta japonica]
MDECQVRQASYASAGGRLSALAGRTVYYLSVSRTVCRPGYTNAVQNARLRPPSANAEPAAGGCVDSPRPPGCSSLVDDLNAFQFTLSICTEGDAFVESSELFRVLSSRANWRIGDRLECFEMQTICLEYVVVSFQE